MTRLTAGAAAGELDDGAFVHLSGGRYLVAGGSIDGGGTPGRAAAPLFDPKRPAGTVRLVGRGWKIAT